MFSNVKELLVDGGESWDCPVCGNENSPEGSPAGEFCEACDSPRYPVPL